MKVQQNANQLDNSLKKNKQFLNIQEDDSIDEDEIINIQISYPNSNKVMTK